MASNYLECAALYPAQENTQWEIGKDVKFGTQNEILLLNNLLLRSTQIDTTYPFLFVHISNLRCLQIYVLFEKSEYETC